MEDKKHFALITGATSGIGYELAKLFAADGHNLIIVSRNEDDLAKTAKSLTANGIEVITIAKDLFEPRGAYEVFEEVSNWGHQIDVLVNDAGQGSYGKFTETDLEKDLNIIQLNISATVILTKLFLREMVKRNTGKILNLASIAGKAPGPYQAVYHGTKAFVHSFSEAIRSELADTNITVTSLLPGATDTDFFNKADMLDSKIVQEGDLADPAQVAKDGYEALLAGQDMVISGFKNKVQVTMGNVIPDSIQANQMKKMQEPVDQKKD
ncbi:SDR family NAD(P)-dependent oxidoreductase [Pedobacter petrophilus]|uniref:SDR family NAD(P)-dependent oxidoreductase n=1 Tax=Pedobacter petrophilus TaxID=1908241 RepID=A0A7K0G298_9SPHI|nr:SDR family oxidoreductase [Pedobacter petrophilus]MRX77570.1 SDR family NAD(P)-dependent oxidoreductase [Pedobacter petrophilus]